ncbi:MAG TPA: PQQ-binding-like beta-propeller repeat protein, partial [Isosphaeraceae bacterium]|nr:PQQ-binding-like beta-propeller repeat protein [Isosphaeraceae bacterium]
MTAMRWAIVILLLSPALALGQAQTKEEEAEKVSNDNPARPLQMPPASTEVKEAFDDFERFQRRGAWERALKALYTIPENQALRFVDGENGFIIPVARKRRQVLTGLPPEGQSAYRLFYDAEARKLFEEAEGPSELKNLERIYSAYFTTSIGDDAADRLGALYFELGRFDRAADCWLAILRERPDSDLSPGLIGVKAALALWHAGRRSEFEQVRGELADRSSGETVTLGGQKGTPAELLRRLMEAENSAAVAQEPKPATGAAAAAPGPDLAGPVDPAWQFRFAESIEAGMGPIELNQWQTHGLSAALPAVTIEGTTLFVNYLGHILALDLASGKLLWRTASFHNLELLAMQPAAQMLDPGRFAIVADGEHVWTLARDLKDQNFAAPYQLICRRSDNGEIIWQSKDLPDYAPFDLVGLPVLAEGKLFLAAKTGANPQQPQQGLPQQLLLAIQPHDGKVLWKTEVGTFRQGAQFRMFYPSRDPSPQPRLVSRGGAVYLDTHVGVLARLDADTGTLDWGYAYKTDPFQSQSRFLFYYYQTQEPQAAPSQPLPSGDAFLVKGAQSGRLYAVDPNRMKVLWERPITKASRLLGADDRCVYLGGAELSALDLRTRKLQWATRVPNGSMDGHVLVRSD